MNFLLGRYEGILPMIILIGHEYLLAQIYIDLNRGMTKSSILHPKLKVSVNAFTKNVLHFLSIPANDII